METQAARMSFEDIPRNSFHWKIAIYSAGGPFCDGYILGIIAPALAVLTPQLDLSALMVSLIGAATLVGIFIGGLLFGYVTDILGRQIMYVLDLATFVVASVLQFFIGEGWQLIVLRLILGVAIGADYPIATALMTEFTPRRHRGFFLSFCVFGWWVGFAAAYVVGYFLVGVGEESWRWMLASSAVPAAIILLLRLGTPESPRWLASKGRVQEALAVVREAFGENADLGDLPPEPPRTSFWNIFRRGYAKRTVFAGAFWLLQVTPLFAIFTFAPTILEAFNLGGGRASYLGSVIISLFAVAGLFPAMYLVDRLGRRPVLIWPFFITGIALLILGIAPKSPAWVIITLFVVFSFFNSGSSVLQWIYPNELFPTEVRATAMGFATAVSRIGAAIGTFLLPLLLSSIGIGPTMIIAAVLCFIGFVMSWFMAPETKGLTLDEASMVREPVS
ncbi:General substrate transporter [Rubrobacter xylanophilus DSM 9941]|uniref:General substrate transporter n=2 Tax=Rubrobacter xylanophilus TaxID=49319 RepID=Q1ATU3_RUBXD|nr:General substrate transporter [Rubrobacter xylanophilus DSM 9941]